MINKLISWPVHSMEEIAAVNRVLLSRCTNYWTGSECREFEKEYAQSVGTHYAISLMNGTVALEAALFALNIGEGDEVITTCRTFIASASCIIMRGAHPVLADVDPNSQNITADTIEPLITPKTKAIIVVHLAGWPANMVEILALAKKYNLKVIEDCAQAHGARLNNKAVGSWGDIGAFSFCQDKIITTGGEGGMITTNDKNIWEKIWAYKDHGKNHEKVYATNHPKGFRWLHDSFGTNWRMTEMQAAIGRLQLKKLPEWLAIRNRNAQILTDKLKNQSALRIPLPSKDFYHSYYKYYVFVKPEMLKSDWNRDRVMLELESFNISCFVGSCSEIYLERAFINHNTAQKILKTTAKMLGETSLMFLVHPTLTEEQMHQTAEGISNILARATKRE